MNQEIIIILSASIGALLIGILLTYLILKSKSVPRDEVDLLREDLAAKKGDLNTSRALEERLHESLAKLESDLDAERDTSRTQERKIAELNTTLQNLNRSIAEEKHLTQTQKEELDHKNHLIQELKTQISQLTIQKENLEEKLQQKSKEDEQRRQKSLTEFENIANRLFEEKTNKFSQQSKKDIEQILDPLKENLKDFKKKVEETYDKESKERFSLEGRIKELVQLNQQISKDANNLTNALKGQSKTQGDWGEMILESILEYSGLIKNRQYFVQESFKDENGSRKQPDVTIKYPDDRYVIIDSKVSLKAYEKFVNCEDLEEQKLHLSQHLQSIKNHIDNLSAKEYEKLDRSLDFVFLFVPIEPAFLAALQYDSQLWNYAYAKRIVLMSPTNLIATLRVIADVWRKEIQNQNAREISKRGEKLYDKFVGFVSDMEEIDKYLGKTRDRYTSAMKKLSDGRGNLIGQAEKLKGLGVKSKKDLPEKFLLDNPELEDESGKDEIGTEE